MKKGSIIILAIFVILSLIVWFSCNPMQQPSPQSATFNVLDHSDSIRATATYGDGFCTQNGGTSGGDGGPTVTVTNSSDFATYVGSHSPYIIMVSGTIDVGSQATVRNDKTIIGIDKNATLLGGLKISAYNNLIVRNLTIKNPNPDGMTIMNAKNVWVDHCTIIDAPDGSIDITHGSDWVTISNCHFVYTTDSGHDFVNLIGHTDDNAAEDMGTLHVTFHDNWWDTVSIERMPSVRYGTVHVYNNYYSAAGNDYCARTRLYAQIRIENNYYENVKNPWEQYVTAFGGTPGKVYASGNNVNFMDTTNGVTWSVSPTADKDGNQSFLIPGTDSVFAPPYAYKLASASNVKASVIASAGPQ